MVFKIGSQPLRRPAHQLIHGFVLKLEHPTAIRTDQMVMPLPIVEFVEGPACIEASVLQQAGVLQLRQDPVDGSESDFDPSFEQEPIDVLGGKVVMARLFKEIQDPQSR